MASSGLQALAASTVVLCGVVLLLMTVVGPRPAMGMTRFRRHEPRAGTQTFNGPFSYYYQEPSAEEICRRRERLYVQVYECLQMRRLMCWLMLQTMENMDCREPCYKHKYQVCVDARLAHGDNRCTPVEALCEGEQTCCKFS